MTGSVPGLRGGFNRVLDLTRTGNVGLVAVVETSRLIRNHLDFATFAALARPYDVLLWHGGHVVDFRDPTSEFIGYFFGSMAVRENRARAEGMRRAKRKKAEAGHASTRPPIGYITVPHGMWDKDPDPAVRNAIQLIFDKFPSIGSAAGLARWLRHSQILLPGKRSRARVPWARATHCAVLGILHNPVYKGEYIFGKSTGVESTDPQSLGRQHRVDRPASEWVRIERHHDPYVSPDRWNEIQRRLTANRPEAGPPLGRGEALVQGLLRCAIHNSTMRTFYPNRVKRDDHTIVRAGCYRCDGVEDGEKRGCGKTSSSRVDQIVTRQLLERLSPPSIVDLRNAATESLREYEALVRQRGDEFLRAERAIEDLERTFTQTSDRHPHVKARLEQRLEDALRARNAIRERHLLNPIDSPPTLSESEINELQQLVGKLPDLWRHPHTSNERRKAIARAAIRRIVVTPRPFTWRLDIHWAGGATSTIEVLTLWGERARVQDGLQHGLTASEVVSALKEGVTGTEAGPSERSVTRMMMRITKLPRPLEVAAYPVIRRLYIEGEGATKIANELNAGGYRHLLGIWTKDRVDKALQLLRRGQVPGIEPIPRYRPLPEFVAAWDATGLSPEEITNRLRQEGAVSRRRRPVTKQTVLLILWKLRRAGKPALLRNRGIRGKSSGATEPIS